MGVKIVTQVKLLPSPEQASAPGATPRACNRAADAVSVAVFGSRVFSRNDLQRTVYGAVKAEFGLSAQPAVRVVEKVVDAYAGLRANIRAGNLGEPGSKRHAKARSRPQRVASHSWAFHQLGSFLAYKAQRAGVALVHVDPAYTSQTCADCHHIEKRNRVSRARFVCRSCGVVAHADRNASRNIARKGEAAWRAGRESRVPATPQAAQTWEATRQPVATCPQTRSLQGRVKLTPTSPVM